MSDAPYVYVSYARIDGAFVHPIVRKLQSLGVAMWMDSDNLKAGEAWDNQIQKALRNARALLLFLSPASARSRSVMAEVRQAAAAGAVIVPVRLARSDEVEAPPEIERLKGFDISELTPDQAASKLAESLAGILAQPAGVVGAKIGEDQQSALATALTAQVRGDDPAGQAQDPPDSVFVVHGHDDDFLAAVVRFVHDLGVRPIVMKEIGGASTSLIQKFFEMGGAARYAIVLLSGDDFGAARFQYEDRDVGDRALQYRARQNVVLELGFFYGLLGWENVFVLERTPPKVFPNFERPSDLNGVLFDRFDASGKWRSELHSRLAKHGFKVGEIPALTH